MPSGDVALSSAQIDSFVQHGFVRLDDAFPRSLADACRRILWRATGCVEDVPSTWTRPVVRVGEIPNPLFREAANTPRSVGSSMVVPGSVALLRARSRRRRERGERPHAWPRAKADRSTAHRERPREPSLPLLRPSVLRPARVLR